ncbi:MAG TPA: hypothetical protein VGT02_08250 [Methylomirabilota bacterium]|jgi:hypothetical protein|nr:hypothetical protein [Methylomirabilota bacterium]
MDQQRLTGDVVAVSDLGGRDVEAMFAVYARLYERVSERDFRRDLDEKQWVLLLRGGPGGPIRGFTTIMLLETRVRGESLRVVFSGDTGIDPAYWGGQALVKAWARFMGELLARDRERRLYWFLISKGYRTYLYLPLFFHEFFPRVDTGTPPFERELIATLGALKYPRDFDPATGVIAFPESHGNLRPALADTPDHRRAHPHVRFFLDANPGYARGHELVCVAEISPDNMRGLPRRMLLEGAGALEAAS